MSSMVLEPLVAALAFHSLLGQEKLSEAQWVYLTHAHIDQRDLLKFVVDAYDSRRMSPAKIVKTIDRFFPEFKKKKISSRGLASEEDIHDELLTFYNIVVEALWFFRF